MSHGIDWHSDACYVWKPERLCVLGWMELVAYFVWAQGWGSLPSKVVSTNVMTQKFTSSVTATTRYNIQIVDVWGLGNDFILCPPGVGLLSHHLQGLPNFEAIMISSQKSKPRFLWYILKWKLYIISTFRNTFLTFPIALRSRPKPGSFLPRSHPSGFWWLGGSVTIGGPVLGRSYSMLLPLVSYKACKIYMNHIQSLMNL